MSRLNLMTLDRCFVLTPYNPNEAMTLQEAASRAGVRSLNTIRNWCESEGLGRRIGGQWRVSKVALEIYLDGELAALDQYLRGNRENSIIVAYFRKFGLTPEKPVIADFPARRPCSLPQENVPIFGGNCFGGGDDRF